MLDRIQEIAAEARTALEAAQSPEAAEAVHQAFLGKSGRLQEILRGIGMLPADQRGPVGKAANEAKTAFEQAHAERVAALLALRAGAIADTEWVDATLPGPKRGGGTIHPVAQMVRELEDVCIAMGFEVVDGPWVEDEEHNFGALNIPKDHPARDMQDTFWLLDGHLLRTHTSPVQIRTMRTPGRSPPIRAVTLGRVFRHEELDASHENTFHHIEGFLVDRGVTVGHLVFTLKTLLAEVFEKEVEVRLRPSYFPFTEPSFEMDVRCLVCGGSGCAVCKRSGWLELLGCGLVHRNVLKAGGIDPGEWSGFAFGLGIDRLVMMRHGIEDIRHLMGGDLRFLRQFARGVQG